MNARFRRCAGAERYVAIIQRNSSIWMIKMTTVMLNEKLARQNRGLFATVVQRLSMALARRAMRNTLLNLDDHLLRDIGLSRHSILSDEF
jgi:uncharacterized protein YjiS (DUF1127 family)